MHWPACNYFGSDLEGNLLLPVIEHSLQRPHGALSLYIRDH